MVSHHVDDHVKAVVCAVAIPVALLQCFYGLKLLRVTLFTCGALLVGGLCGLATYGALEGESFADSAALAVGLILGLLAGSLAVKVYSTGIVLVGATAGALFAMYLQTTMLYKIPPEGDDTPFYVALVVLMLLGIYIVWKLQQVAVILFTAFCGAYGAVAAAGYFIGHYPNPFNLQKTMDGEQVDDDAPDDDDLVSIPRAWWGYFAATLLLFAAGLYVQTHHTGRAAAGDHSDYHVLPDQQGHGGRGRRR